MTTKPKDWSPVARYPSGALGGDVEGYVELLKKNAVWATTNLELIRVIPRGRFDSSREESYTVADNLVPWLAAHFLLACIPVRYVIASTRPDRHPDRLHLEFFHAVSGLWIALDPHVSGKPSHSAPGQQIDSDDLAPHLMAVMAMANAKCRVKIITEERRGMIEPVGYRLEIWHSGPEEWITLETRYPDDQAWTAAWRENLE